MNRPASVLRPVIEPLEDRVLMSRSIKGAGRWLAAGAAGALLLGTGCVFLVLGVLRMVQNEFGKSFRGSWTTMLPYLFAFVASLAVVGVAAWRITKKKTLQKGS